MQHVQPHMVVQHEDVWLSDHNHVRQELAAIKALSTKNLQVDAIPEKHASDLPDVLSDEELVLEDGEEIEDGRSTLMSRVSNMSARRLSNQSWDIHPLGFVTERIIDFDDIKDSLEYLGEGAMCQVFKAVLDGEVSALKVPLPDGPTSSVNDIQLESLLMNHLNHPNILTMKGSGTTPKGMPFVMLEYMGGGTLSDRIAKTSSRKVPLLNMLRHAVALAKAISYLHYDAFPGNIIMHRDLKPDNVGFDNQNEVKLFDFGLAKVVKRQVRGKSVAYQMTGGTGSIRYMAPEVVLNQPYNEKSEVYSLSILLWEMFTFKKPYSGLSVDDFTTKVVRGGERPPIDKKKWPKDLQDLFEYMWKSNLDERASMIEVVAVLESVLAELEGQKK
ncbi:unnamed protein product [Chrysoparadoxa australica]